VGSRPARGEDLDAIGGIERGAFSDPWSRSSFSALVDERYAYFVVAERDVGPIVGYAVSLVIAGQAELANIAVAQDARGEGIGARLLEATLAEAVTRGADDLFLEVRESNDVARSMYESRGFSEIGRRRRYYRRPVEDAIIMRLSLVPAEQAASTALQHRN
jgi:[ribosomal protein S18]-alanine N-acetyltransferase